MGRRILTLIGAMFILYLGGALIFESVPLFGRYQHYVVVSDSMAPTIDVHDVVIIDRRGSFSEGDIIAFETTLAEQTVPVIHYLDEIESDNGRDIYHTRPEEGPRDDWVLERDDILGAHALTIPRIGRMFAFFGSAIGRVVLVINILGVVLIARLLTRKT